MFMGDLMRLTGSISVLGPLVVYVLIYFLEKIRFNSNAIWRTVLLAYICVIVYLTIVSKCPPGREHQLNLILFWSYERWYAEDVRWQVYMNLFLFIPFGFFVRKKFLTTLLISLAFSATIELTQYIFRLGLCELDDVFHNTLGGVIGGGYYLLISFLCSKYRKRLNIGWIHKK